MEIWSAQIRPCKEHGPRAITDIGAQRQFAKASGVLAKNDRLDARMIASFVAVVPTDPVQRRAPAVERLAEMVTVRRQLSDDKIAAENASRMLENPMLQRLSRRRIARLAADIAEIDERLVEIVLSDPRSLNAVDYSHRCRGSAPYWHAL
jgi:transposase